LFSSKFKSLEFLHGHALVFLSPGLSMVLGYSLSHIIGGGTGTIAKIWFLPQMMFWKSISTKILLLEILQQLFTEQLLLFFSTQLRR
jgi:hypothetical protein